MSGGPAAKGTGGVLGQTEDASRLRLDILFRTEAPRLLRYFRRKTGSSDTAADLMQEAFLRLAVSVGRSDLRNPAAYLQRTARNLLVDRARRAEFRLAGQHVPFDERVDGPVAPDQAAMIEARDTLGQFETAILGLSPKTAEVFLLHRIDGLTYSAIQERMGMSLGSVEYHIMRALVHIDRVVGAR